MEDILLEAIETEQTPIVSRWAVGERFQEKKRPIVTVIVVADDDLTRLLIRSPLYRNRLMLA